MKEFENLLTNAFGYKDKPAPVYTPAIKPEVKAIPVERSMDAETVASVQSITWGTGPLPLKAPNQKMLDQGTTPSMSEQKGWGKL